MLKSRNLKSKYGNIQYPFFGTYSVPDITVDFNEIRAALSKTMKKVKVSDSSNYLEELLNLEINDKENRFKFQVTATNTSELLMLPKRCVWGVDSKGSLHNLSRYEEYDMKCLRPKTITKDKYIWFTEITKPIVAPLSIKNIKEDILEYWFYFLYIDYNWELRKIDPDYNGSPTEWI